MTRHAVHTTAAVVAQDDQTLADLRARAESGAANSQYTLGFMYEFGLYGAPQDYAKALTWYHKAAAQGYADAQYNLGRMHADGEGVPQDDVEAYVWLNLAASRLTGEGRERTVAARDAVAARLTPADLREAQRLARKWRRGDIRTTRDRTLAFLGGYVSAIVRITVAVAARCLAMLSSPTPPRALADMCARGEAGDAEAQFTLGFIYDFGVGVQEDDAEAVAWYRKAATQGHATAQNNLGRMHADGEGVPQNDIEAVDWYRKAAMQGDATAQKNLGVMYDQGRGVQEDDAEAVAWYRKAATQGDATAQYNLGVSCATGEGVPQNDVEAHMWLNLAASRSIGAEREQTVTARDALAARMTPADLSEAQRLAQEWHAAHPVP